MEARMKMSILKSSMSIAGDGIGPAMQNLTAYALSEEPDHPAPVEI